MSSSRRRRKISISIRISKRLPLLLVLLLCQQLQEKSTAVCVNGKTSTACDVSVHIAQEADPQTVPKTQVAVEAEREQRVRVVLNELAEDDSVVAVHWRGCH